MRQKLRQNNSGARLHLTEEDFLVASETPRNVDGFLRMVKLRYSRDHDGYAERAVYDFSRDGGGFWHYHLFMPKSRLAELSMVLERARQALEKITIREDPNGVYRTICFWRENTPYKLAMEYEWGEPRYQVSEFEDAWLIISQQFPPHVAWDIPHPKL